MDPRHIQPRSDHGPVVVQRRDTGERLVLENGDLRRIGRDHYHRGCPPPIPSGAEVVHLRAARHGRLLAIASGPSLNAVREGIRALTEAIAPGHALCWDGGNDYYIERSILPQVN